MKRYKLSTTIGIEYETESEEEAIERFYDEIILKHNLKRLSDYEVEEVK